MGAAAGNAEALPTVKFVPSKIPAGFVTIKVPEFTNVPPVYVFVPESNNVPVPEPTAIRNGPSNNT